MYTIGPTNYELAGSRSRGGVAPRCSVAVAVACFVQSNRSEAEANVRPAA